VLRVRLDVPDDDRAELPRDRAPTRLSLQVPYCILWSQLPQGQHAQVAYQEKA